MSELAPTPWAYRPLEHDDWGTIRAADGAIVARSREGKFGLVDYDAFRTAGTDPYELIGQRIVEATLSRSPIGCSAAYAAGTA